MESQMKEKRTERIAKLVSARERKSPMRYDVGFSTGVEWAQCEDIQVGLRRARWLRQYLDEDDWVRLFESRSRDKRDRITKLIKIVNMLNFDWGKEDSWLSAELWIKELGERLSCDLTHPEFMRGLAEGALSVQSSVKDGNA